MTLNDKYAAERRIELAAKERATKAANLAANTVINHTTVRPIVRQSQDIGKWRTALVSAEQEHEQRSLLYDLYSEILLDGRLDALIQQRISRITNAKIKFSKDGMPVDEVNDLTKRAIFNAFLEEALQARFWGFSLLELYWPGPKQKDFNGATNLVPRKHVKPKRGVVTKNAWDIVGLPFREAPYTDYCIEVGKVDDLGILLKCCANVIYKRGGFGDWAEFAEVFGMPFRWATYSNEQSRGVLETALAQAGSAGYVVAPEDAHLEFHNPTAGSSSNDIFRFLIDACNQELSITVLGNSMTTQEAKHSGYAQSETQQDTQDELHKDDRAFVLRVLNEKLVPYLASLGYPVEGGCWEFHDEDGLSLPQRLTMDLQLGKIVPIAKHYWYEKYQLPMPADGEEADILEDSQPDPVPGAGKDKKGKEADQSKKA